MIYTYTPSQKFDPIKISVLLDKRNISEKISHIIKKIYFVL